MTDMSLSFLSEGDTENALLGLDGVEGIEGLPKLTIFSSSRNLYLSKKGWSKTAAYLPVEVVSASDPVRIKLARAIVDLIFNEEVVDVKESRSGFQAQVSWQSSTKSPEQQEADPPPLPVPLPSTLDVSEPTIVKTRSASLRYLPTIVALFSGVVLGVAGAVMALPRGVSAESAAPASFEPGRVSDYESNLVKNKNENNVLVSKINAQVKLILDQRVENDRLRMEVAAAKLGVAPQKSSLDTSSSAEALRKQLDEVKLDRSLIDARVKEQEKMIKARDEEIASLRSPPSALKNQLLASASPSATTASEIAVGRGVWGGAAISQGGSVYALQNQFSSKDVARDIVALCEGRSKSKCELLNTYNNSCLSVARERGGINQFNFRIDVQSTPDEAERSALRLCQRDLGSGCRTAFTTCSPDGLKPFD